MQAFITRWKDVFARVTAIPVVFLGVGIYRAWLAIFFRYGTFPTVGTFDYFFFEGAIGVASLALAFSARKIAPIWSNKTIRCLTALCMVVGSSLVVLACFIVESTILKLVGLMLAGVGLASLILMWAEFYGSINPMRVALYHAIAIFLGEIIKWLFLGLSAPYLAFFAIVLPLVSLRWVRLSMHRLPTRDLPQKTASHDTYLFPWKPLLLMSVCTFAGGFGALPATTLLPGNTIGALLVTALVFFGVLSASKWFNFDTIYQLAFPLFIIGFLLVSPTLSASSEIMALCYEAGYTMLSMFIMLVLSNITYRFGISAVWISGIERGIRYIVELMGWTFYAFVSVQTPPATTSVIYTSITLAMIIIFIIIFFTEKGLSARWGLNLQSLDDQPGKPSVGKLSLRVSSLAKEHDLSPREEEVLQLVARKKTVAQIEEDLYVAQGTIKAHISHIYRKLDVHSRNELHELLEDSSPDQKVHS
ncbi:MAG: LuxR C-terminal-related transcriptional regulator [Raoultibacter sp.]